MVAVCKFARNIYLFLLAWQKNNVMARLNLTDTNRQLEFVSLGVKEWTDLEMDTANDGGKYI